MKPDWKDAPEWANYLAMDRDGLWYWYDVEPQVENGCRWNLPDHNGRFMPVGDIWCDHPNYDETLEQRPDEA